MCFLIAMQYSCKHDGVPNRIRCSKRSKCRIKVMKRTLEGPCDWCANGAVGCSKNAEECLMMGFTIHVHHDEENAPANDHILEWAISNAEAELAAHKYHTRQSDRTTSMLRSDGRIPPAEHSEASAEPKILVDHIIQPSRKGKERIRYIYASSSVQGAVPDDLERGSSSLQRQDGRWTA